MMDFLLVEAVPDLKFPKFRAIPDLLSDLEFWMVKLEIAKLWFNVNMDKQDFMVCFLMMFLRYLEGFCQKTLYHGTFVS
jgi:hypothetical protein